MSAVSSTKKALLSIGRRSQFSHLRVLPNCAMGIFVPVVDQETPRSERGPTQTAAEVCKLRLLQLFAHRFETPRRQSIAALTRRTCCAVTLLQRGQTGMNERRRQRTLRLVGSCHLPFGGACAPATCLAVASKARDITLMRHKARGGGRAAGKAHADAAGALGALNAAAAAAASAKGLFSRSPLPRLLTRASWRKAFRIRSQLKRSLQRSSGKQLRSRGSPSAAKLAPARDQEDMVEACAGEFQAMGSSADFGVFAAADFGVFATTLSRCFSSSVSTSASGRYSRSLMRHS